MLLLLYPPEAHLNTEDLPEMEFLDINLTKTQVFYAKLFTAHSTGGFERKQYSSLVLKIFQKYP